MRWAMPMARARWKTASVPSRARPGGAEAQQQLQADVAWIGQQQNGLEAQLQVLGAQTEQLALDRVVRLEPLAVARPEQMQSPRVLIGQGLPEGLQPQPGLVALAAPQVLGHDADVIVLAGSRQEAGADPDGDRAHLLQPAPAAGGVEQRVAGPEPDPQREGVVPGPVATPGPAGWQGRSQVLMEKRENGGDGGGGFHQQPLPAQAAAVNRHQQGDRVVAGCVETRGLVFQVMLQRKA